MNLKALLESKIREFDGSIDLSDGSRVQRTVIAPVVSALSVDPLSVSTRDYLYARFSEVFPEAPITRGNALDDILITAAEYFMSGYREELARLKNSTSLENINLLSDDEADALASNWFVSRDDGASATGSVTVIVDRTAVISINAASVRFYAGDVEFAPTISTVISTDALLAGSLGGGIYEFSINVQAVSAGVSGNVAAGAITRTSGISNVVSVTNDSPMLGGIARDTTAFLLSNKLPRAISERSLVTARGLGARISTDIPGILRYQVIGHGDVEMLRDRVEVDTHSQLVANGHIFYMENFAIIAGYPHLSDTLVPNDRVYAISRSGAPSEHTIRRVLGGLDTSVLNGSDVGFTKLVELDASVARREGDHVSILRPSTAVLGDSIVSGTVGLGGRTDVYIRSDVQQEVAGSASISYDDVKYRGKGWLRSGNVIDIRLESPTHDTMFSRYDHVIVEGEAYTISAVVGSYRSADGADMMRFNVFDQDFTESAGEDYYVVDQLAYSTGAESVQVSPPAGGLGRLSAVIGSMSVSIEDVSLLEDGVVQGDIIDIPEYGIRRSIFSVDAQNHVTTDSPFLQTLSDVGARVIRPVPTLVSPVAEIDVPLYSRRHPLSVDVTAIREERGVISSGVGNVLLPLGDRLVEAYADANVGTVFANVADEDSMFYRVVTHSEGGNQVNRLTPVALGYSKERIGRCSVLVGESSALTDNKHPRGISEFSVWTDLFTSNANNIFVLRGDALSSARFLDAPGDAVQDGDILRIKSGYLSGDYIIESVIHNKLLRVGKNALTHEIPGIANVVFHEGEQTYRDISSSALDPDVRFQCVTLVRIYGQFPNNPMFSLAKYLNLSITYRQFIGVDGRPVGSIDSEFFNAYINGTSDMFRQSVSSEILSDFRQAVSGIPMPGDTSDTAIDIAQLFSQTLTSTYEIVRPSEGLASLQTVKPTDQVLLKKPSTQVIDVNDIIGELSEGVTRSITFREYTELVGRVGTYHLSPTTPYYTGGPDYRQWDRPLLPAVYDDRSVTPSYQDRYSPEFHLFDELVESGSSGTLPVKMSGLSSVTAPYLRDSGVRLIRYPETDLCNSSLKLLETNAVTVSSYIFGAIAFSAEETRVVPVGPSTTPRAYVLLPEDSIDVYGDVLALNYIYVGTPEYEALLSSLGDAVDGTGTPLSEVYGQYDAFFELESTYESSREVLEYLVSLYGQTVEARFWKSLPEQGYYVTDEFLLESLLYGSGAEYSVPEILCRPISIATVSQRSDRLEVIPSTTLSVLASDLAGAKARISYRDEVYWRTVTYASNMELFVDEPVPFGTPAASAYGLCIYDLLDNKILLISDPIFSGGVGALEPWDQEYTTHLNTGGASRQLTLTDIGNHITLWGYRTNEANYSDVLLSAPRVAFETEAEFLSSIMRPERETFGQFEITNVVPTFVDVAEGAAPVPATIEVSISGSVVHTSPRIDSSETSLVMCAFVVTPPTLTIEDEIVNNVAEVTVYRSTPYVYDIVGVGRLSPSQYLVQTREGSLGYTYDLIEDILISGDAVSSFALKQDISLEPSTLETGNLVMFGHGQDLMIRTTNAREAISHQSIRADGAAGIGYSAEPASLGESVSTRDNITLRVPCTQGPVPQTLPLVAYFDAATGLAQALVDADSERPVCADILVKNLHTAYIGVDASYVGGPSEEEVTEALSEFVKGQILSDGAITRSMVTSLIVNMGAATVHEPIDLYVCIEDNERRVHKRTIVDGLDEDTLFSVEVTLRTLYPSIAVDNRLGASIQVRRFTTLSNLIGNGGS